MWYCGMMEVFIYFTMIIFVIILIFFAIKCIKIVNKVDNLIMNVQEKLDSFDNTFINIEQGSTLLKKIIDYIIDLKEKLIGSRRD